ncbi:MATE efflux family protein [Candida parapsilosis]|uniref:Uncharacterized protein n=2 Tax=Candida parapsilosis TaxID=5480 RepID=G8B649_CANPC|nr:uncharacterized protein CPAR2_110160 [Candida parapsilosis]KAF6043342.1 MATE efflux family protein [Candida parapsilosis]KAF6049080.1 MATE efflux family protein [Candida parapsilosis]KAF6056931.1 MATE efflux family protein [Candida parapsilosis]KAF6066350.1 MATE efflux family protein [Candida parapsilosis]KAI5902742.1 putative transporter [Candida parapsilosis]
MHNENTPLLHHDRRLSHISEVDENEVVSYVRQKRQSIVSAQNDMPRLHHEAISPAVLHPHGSQDESTSLSPQVSHSTVLSQTISEILLHHTDDIGPEPKTTLVIETRLLLKFAVPIVITFLLQYSLTFASVLSVGRLGSTELAAVSLSSMTANISGYAITQGVSTCLDTLCAQAFGRKEFNQVGVAFVRCNYLLLLCCIPTVLIWTNSNSILKLIVQDQPELCDLASRYLKILSIGIPGFVLFENAKHFLQCQGIFHASTYVLGICAPVNAILNYVLVWNKTLGVGFIGAPIAVVVTNWLMCGFIYSYIFFIDGYQCWPKQYLIDKVYFTNWSRMISLSIPGVLMVEAEWLAFEIITFQAAKLGTTTLAAQSIVSTTLVVLYQIPFGMSVVCSTRIAWYIGAASGYAAKLATKASVYTSIVFGFINCAIILTFRHSLAKLYTKNQEVIEVASKVLIVGAAYQISDFISCSTGGVLRGQGRQYIGGILNLIGYYLIALPCAFYFAFICKLELIGLWYGMIIALLVVSLSQLYFTVTSNWDKIIDECVSEGVADDGNLTIDAHSLLPSMSSTIVV